jgi:3-oxoacyl-[acyl-carrier protein] reductase
VSVGAATDDSGRIRAIVSIGSTTGTVNAMPGQSTYAAAKAGLVGLSRALAL